jgi:hypothetical protein
MMGPRADDRAQNAHQKGHTQCKAFGIGLIVILGLHTLHGSCKAEVLGFIYFPIVPKCAASHGCVRIESVDVARLIQDNSLVDDTKVVVSGTWTKPLKQWT